MQRLLSCCLVILVLCGCSHSHRLRSMSDEEAHYFEERASKDSFSVQMKDGRSFTGTDLVVETDSIGWYHAESGQKVWAAAYEIRQIVFVSWSRGFVDGFLIGFAVGGSTGGLFGYVEGEDCTGRGGDEMCWSREAGATLGVVAIGVPAGLVGGFIGSQVGSRDIYYP